MKGKISIQFQRLSLPQRYKEGRGRLRGASCILICQRIKRGKRELNKKRAVFFYKNSLSLTHSQNGLLTFSLWTEQKRKKKREEKNDFFFFHLPPPSPFAAPPLTAVLCATTYRIHLHMQIVHHPLLSPTTSSP